MKAHLIDTHLLVPQSRSSAKVKVKYQGHVSQKVRVSGALVFFLPSIWARKPGGHFVVALTIVTEAIIQRQPLVQRNSV